MAEPEREFDRPEGTAKIQKIVEKETSDRFKSAEKKIKRGHVFLGAAVAVLSALIGAVRWESGLGKAEAIEAVAKRVGVLEETVRQHLESDKQDRAERRADRAAHDAELRWIADKFIEFKQELDGVARVTGAPVRRNER